MVAAAEVRRFGIEDVFSEQMTRLIIPTLVTFVLSGTALTLESAHAANGHYCHRVIETAFVKDFVPGCQPGDTLVLQISSRVGPGPIIGQLCDLRHEIWHEKLPHQDTVVCVFREKELRAK